MSAVGFQTAVQQEEARLRAVHPTPEDVPGCVKLLDDFLLCNVLGNQIKSLYRYGETAQCSQKLDDFKFCLSTTSMHPEQRREQWIHRRAQWWARRRLEKSSEDVWDMRTEPLKNYPPASDAVQSLDSPLVIQ